MVKPILGADTETNFGYCRLLCIENNIHHHDPETGNWRQWLEYLLNIGGRIAFFNLRFDVESILKHFPEDFIQNLLYLTEAEIQTPTTVFTFKLIPWKVFTIREMGFEKNRRRTKRKIEMFDAAQFYQCSLNQASKDVLKEEKIEDPEFARSLNESTEPWDNEFPRILEYCQDDANKAGRLIRTFIESASSDPINLSPRNPISCAWYAKELIKQCIPETKSIKSMRTGSGHYYSRPWKRWDNVGSQCYFGGRFEVLEKGTFHHVYNYDINSAYPNYIAQLPNPFNLKFLKDKEPEGDWSMVKAEVWVPEDLPVGPLPYRTDDSIIFPLGNWTGWFHWHELKNAIDNFGVIADISKSLNGFEPEGEQRPFQERIPKFYNQRLIWKNTGDPRQLSSKIAMNSGYGVFYEKNERITETDQSRATEIDGHLLKKTKDNPGRFFFPFLAGWITSKTRVQILNAADLDALIFFATDGVLSKKPIPNLQISKKLGEWSCKEVERARVFGNGIYELDGKIKTRGFRKDSNKDKRPVKDRMVEEDGSIFIETLEKGPIHLNSSFRLRDYSLKDALTWIEKPKKMNITQCKKRHWPKFTIDDLYEKQIHSRPRIVNPTGINRNPGLVWKGDSGDNSGITNRFILGKIQVANDT